VRQQDGPNEEAFRPMMEFNTQAGVYVLADDNTQGYLGEPLPIARPFKHGFSAGDEYETSDRCGPAT
jgi:hypothetical protein